ncbi:site-specific integrase [Falsiroseomonas oryzae]|uniref:hypothetical protein n=1 Tax=Falsiroseomonas oryzae TaxID=2766473 RepID=UPI0022EAFEB5|nr:hypothetical protein [Roseomonas sp. MO-31]
MSGVTGALQAQRTRDALRLSESTICNRGERRWINLRLGKTGELLAIPLHDDPLRVDAENPVDGHDVCPSPDGTLRADSSFANAWDRNVSRANFRIARRLLKANPLPHRRNAKARGEARLIVRKWLIVGLQRRDLRHTGTGMVELALSGVPDTQIAVPSGHSIDVTKRVLDRYIPRAGPNWPSPLSRRGRGPADASSPSIPCPSSGRRSRSPNES